MLKIAIVGCGYIGSHIAKDLSVQGNFITGTTTRPENKAVLQDHCNRTVIMKGTDLTSMRALISENDVIIVTLAPKHVSDYESTYLDTAKTLKQAAIGSMLQNKMLIYTSSTSVYAEQDGNWTYESSPIKQDSLRAQILSSTEQTFNSLNQLGWSVCIFRLSEIYGPGREISKRLISLSSSSMPGSGQRFTNMIHLLDIVGAVHFAIDQKLNGIFNLSDDDHITREEMMNRVCASKNLPMVTWNPDQPLIHGGNKKISNQKIKSAGYVFKFPHRVIS